MGERIDCRTVEERPLPEGKLYVHPNAVDDGGCSDGCCDDYYCPDCGTRWRFEWPD